MNYYSKYLKYKSKYFQLKFQSGGGECHFEKDKFYSYYLVAHFNKEQEDLMEELKQQCLKEFVDYITPYQDKVKPHLTLIYGPAKKYDSVDSIELRKEQTKDEQDKIIEKIYPGIIGKFDSLFFGKMPVLKFKCISIFIRKDRIILKAEYSCEELEEFIRFARSNLEFYKENMEIIKKEYEDNKEEMKKIWGELFEEDKTLDEEKPTGFLHATLCSIDVKKLNKEQLAVLLERANKIGIDKGLVENTEFMLKSIDIRNPCFKDYFTVRSG